MNGSIHPAASDPLVGDRIRAANQTFAVVVIAIIAACVALVLVGTPAGSEPAGRDQSVSDQAGTGQPGSAPGGATCRRRCPRPVTGGTSAWNGRVQVIDRHIR